MACDGIESQSLAAVAVLRPRVDEHEAWIAEPLEDLVRGDHVVRSLARREDRGLDRLLALGQRAEPDPEPSVEHPRLIVAEVAQQPPEPRRAARHALVVGDDERTRPDARTTGSIGELLRRRQRMAAAHLRRHGQVRELRVEVEERRAGDVTFEVARAGRRRIGEVIAAVGEAHLHAWQYVRGEHLVGRLGLGARRRLVRRSRQLQAARSARRDAGRQRLRASARWLRRVPLPPWIRGAVDRAAGTADAPHADGERQLDEGEAVHFPPGPEGRTASRTARRSRSAT